MSQKSPKRVRKSGFRLFLDSFETPGRTAGRPFLAVSSPRFPPAFLPASLPASPPPQEPGDRVRGGAVICCWAPQACQKKRTVTVSACHARSRGGELILQSQVNLSPLGFLRTVAVNLSLFQFLSPLLRLRPVENDPLEVVRKGPQGWCCNKPSQPDTWQELLRQFLRHEIFETSSIFQFLFL